MSRQIRSLRSLARRLTSLGTQEAAQTGLRSAHCAVLPAALEASAPGASSAQRRFAGSHAHAPADELASGPLPEAAAAAEPVELLEETLQDEEQEEGASELDATILPPLPSGPGSEFVRSDPLGSLQLGERLEASAKFHGRPWLFETGRMARLADGSCTLRVGDTTLLATAVCSTQSGGRRDPLAPQMEVEYREKWFAVGRIPSGYNKREGGPPKEGEVLAGRRVDRALRPLVPKGFIHDMQVSISVLSADGQQDLDVAAINAASAAMLCSDIPWGGPVAAARVTLDAAGHLHVNVPPEQQELGPGQQARLRLLVAVTADRVVMVEAEGMEVPEKEFARALHHGAKEARKLLQPQLDLAAKAGRAKRAVQLAGADPAAALKVLALAEAKVEGIVRNEALDKTSRARALQHAKAEVEQRIRDMGSFRLNMVRQPGSGCVSPSDIDNAFTGLLLRVLRRLALEENLRADGRGLIDCRELHCELDTVPVVHGSALFTRGETQSLCTVTVGGRGDEQRTDSLLEGEGSKRLAVHYAFPAFAINEVNVNGQRRATGHSSLAEKALLPVMPEEQVFPFPLRLNADTLASNGSSSLAAVCGGSLALWDAGVPLKSMVAGVSIGLMTERGWDGLAAAAGGEAAGEAAAWPPFGRYELLTDVMGLEDQLGDMDFKVAGSRAGITACQLDVKVPGGVPEEVLIEALERARLARLSILDAMEASLPKERLETSPRFGTVRVAPSSMGRVIGTGGSNIKEVEAQCGARIHSSEDDAGLLSIYAPSAKQFEEAKQRVLEFAGENIQEGQRYTVKVVRLADFGAFVEFSSGVRSLLHISEVSASRIRSVEDALSVGEEVEVLCLGRDARGNIKVSRKALLAKQGAARREA